MTSSLQPAVPGRISYLKRTIAQKETALKNAPAGHLLSRSQNGKYYYEYKTSGPDPHRRYLSLRSKDDMALAKGIAQRDYDERVLKRCRRELRILEELERFYAEGLPEGIAGNMSGGRRALIAPISLTDAEYAERWQMKYQAPGRISSDEQSFSTERGERVRSKSEAFIADKLYKLGIPYCYEYPVKLTDHITGKVYTAHPDFLVLNARERKTYVWEHLGSCDKADYVNKNLNRLIDYEKAGFASAGNLILSFETKSVPFDAGRAESLIRSYLM